MGADREPTLQNTAPGIAQSQSKVKLEQVLSPTREEPGALKESDSGRSL